MSSDPLLPVPLDLTRVPASFLELVPRDFARSHLLLAQQPDEGESDIVLMTAETSDPCAVHNLEVTLGVPCRVRPMADASALAAAIDRAFETRESSGSKAEIIDAQATVQMEEPLDAMLQHAEKDLLATSGKAPVVRLVDALLFHAVRLGASDLHLQPLSDRVVIRHRVDGVLDHGRELPTSLLTPIVSRIKVMAGMDVAEHLLPQDGRTTVRIGDRACDVRVASMPTPHGERMVLRLLDASRQLQSFTDLGMPDDLAQAYLTAARRSSGIILVTGPTGSGKTTTLYATLRELDSRERNIVTIEDPIEYELDALGLPISQSQVNAKKGVTFATGLRHLLRQDPDIILVGEIRDAETARIAIQASLTGHLVLSTLHTNDAPSAVTRLIDLGVEPYLVAASLSLVIAQRLVRTTCTTCHGTSPLRDTCPTCDGTGLRGRHGIFELLTIDDSLRSLISTGTSLQDLRSMALTQGMRSLRAHGDLLVAQGLTTAIEVDRVVHG